MAEIWTMGEMIVEIMRTEEGAQLYEARPFLGPFPSGAPAICIDTAAKMGHTAGIIGGVGKDDFGKCLLDRLRADGVDCSRVLESEDYFTGTAFVTYFADGSRRFLFHMANTAAVLPRAPEETDPEARFFHIMGCSLMADRQFGREILKTMEAYRKQGTKISFDPNVRPELFTGEDMILLRQVLDATNVFLPGKSELLAITGEQSVESAVEKCFSNPNLEILALKDGSRGAVIYTRSERHTVGIYPVEVQDATGAGDSFDGAFLCCLVEGKTPKEAARVASAAAAINTAAFGPMEGRTTKENIRRMMGGN